MDATAIAVVALGVVSLASMAVVCLCMLTLRKAAQERRQHWERSVLVERAAETAEHPSDLVPLAMAMQTEPQRREPPTRVQKFVDQQIREQMLEAHLDPDDMDDVSVYRAMRSIGMDPTSPEDVMAWNEIEPV